MIIALNIMFAAIVIVGIVGMLAWSIASQDGVAGTGLLRSARRRRRTTARSQFIGRSVENRA
jgi:predicted small integral membrane protein